MCGHISLKKVKKTIMILLLASFVVAILLLPYYEFTSHVIEKIHETGKTVIQKIEEDNKRAIIYIDLWEMIKKDPIFGAGWGEYTERTGEYPHQNILGIWAEIGILTMLAYLVNFYICISCSMRIVRLMLQERGNEIVYIAACFCMMALFLHLKGFVHDTWHERHLWLYSGSMLGLAYNPALFEHSLRLGANRRSRVSRYPLFK
jgi:O-antigen ligase